MQVLKLSATNNGSNNHNHADWADAKLAPKTQTVDMGYFGYCGEYYDPELDMIYLRNRYYCPGIGRFITEDPARDGANWYAYCNNNPVMFVDPFGLYYIATNGNRTNLNIEGDAINKMSSGNIRIRDGVVDISKEYPKSIRLDIPVYDQFFVPAGRELIKLPKGCMALSAAMCETYYTGNNSNRAVEFAQYSHGGDITQIYESVNIDDAKGILSYDVTLVNRVLSFEEIVGEICSGKPIISVVKWDDSARHAIVIKGYKIEGGGRYILYNDPYMGRNLEIGYSRMLKGKIPDWNGTMVQNYLTGREFQ